MAPSPAKTAISTPTKAPLTPATESPGTWRHPRLPEIAKRQAASSFTEKNVKRIVINVVLLGVLLILHSFVRKALPSKRSAPQLWTYYRYIRFALLALPLYNITTNLLPLIRTKDDLSDIPLTPGQRKLLGLPPTSTPPTPGSVYSTPPRFARTPSASGSGTGRRSFSSSPVLTRSPSNQGSPTPAGNGSTTPGRYPLIQKAMLGARHTPRRGSVGSSSPLGASISTSASIFGSSGGPPDTPSPSPAGKLSTVGLNSKWRYDKGMYGKPKGFRDLNTESVYG
ncbi:putative nuclear pore complex component [Rosellinia necatrix]|uniref:Putative nuclear pore complex component n=1 Tax=Rosellinia necatrix TaxID=77044 RepID=A0A1W2TWQ4_ROSNE|nr:putative nuclear pore complex component [Rosellinia necatrix]